MNTKSLLCALAATAALATAADAATIRVTENGRDQVAGTVVRSDPGSAIALGTLSGTAFADVFGLVFAGQDSYSFTIGAGETYDLNFIFGGVPLAGGGSFDPTGLTDFDAAANPKTVEFSLEQEDPLLPGTFNSVASVNLDTSITSGDPSIFTGLGEGSYILNISGLGVSTSGSAFSGAFYDLNLTASPIPLPASALLLLGGIAGLGFASRRRKG